MSAFTAKLKQLASNPRGRLVLAGAGAGAVALLALARRGGEEDPVASSAPAAAGAGPGAVVMGPDGNYMSAGGAPLYGIAPPPTIDDTSAQTFNDTLSDHADQLGSISDTVTGLSELISSLAGPSPPAPAPPPPPPNPPATSSAAGGGGGKPSFNPGFFRSGGFNSPVMFRNEKGATAAASLAHAQSTAITNAAQQVKKTGKPTQFTIPGVSGTYYMNTSGSFERTKA